MLERFIHSSLQHLRPAKNREFFLAPYRLLAMIVDKLATRCEDSIKDANELIEMIIELRKRPADINWMDGLDPSVFGVPSANVTIVSAKQTTILQLRNITPDQVSDLLKDFLQTYITNIVHIPVVPNQTPEVKKDEFLAYLKSQIQSRYNLRKTDLAKVKLSNFTKALKVLPVKYI
jgi:hypothetical protein